MKILLPVISASDHDNIQERGSAAAASSIQLQPIAASAMANAMMAALTAARRLRGTPGGEYLKKAQTAKQSRNEMMRNVTGKWRFPAAIEMALH